MPHTNWAVRLNSGPEDKLLESEMSYRLADSVAHNLSKSNPGKSYAVVDSRKPSYTYAVYRDGKDIS